MLCAGHTAPMPPSPMSGQPVLVVDDVAGEVGLAGRLALGERHGVAPPRFRRACAPESTGTTAGSGRARREERGGAPVSEGDLLVRLEVGGAKAPGRGRAALLGLRDR